MIESAFFGIIQGLTEFLPVSSSGHLFVLRKLLKIPSDLLSFFVFLHLATLFSVVSFLHKDIFHACKNKKLIDRLAVTTTATVIFVFLIGKIGIPYFGHKYVISAGFLVTTLFLCFIRKGGTKTVDELPIRDCLFIGLMQACAVFPGISRSGITITSLMKRGVKKNEAFTFSFLIAIPVIVGASIVELKDLKSTFTLPSLAAGCILAFLTGLFALKMVKIYVNLEKIYQFGYYCLFMSIFVLFL